MVRAIPFGKLLKTHVWALVCGDIYYSVSAKTTDSILQLRVAMYFPENCVAAFILAFYLSLKVPCEQRLLSSMAFSFHDVVLVASRLRCWFVYLHLPPRETGGVNKPTTRLTSDENDFVKAKTPYRKETSAHRVPTLLRRDEENSYSILDFSYFVFRSSKVHLTIQKRVKR